MPKRINRTYKLYMKHFIAAGGIGEGIKYDEATATVTENFQFAFKFDGLDHNYMIFSLAYSVNGYPKEYDIQVISKPSNLGKGLIYYFLCPVTSNPCRILYFDSYTGEFCSRGGFSQRLYYPIQLRGRRDRYNARYWELEKEIEELAGAGEKYSRAAYNYNGKETKRSKKIEKLSDQQYELDLKRWTYGMPASLQKQIFGKFMYQQ